MGSEVNDVTEIAQIDGDTGVVVGVPGLSLDWVQLGINPPLSSSFSGSLVNPPLCLDALRADFQKVMQAFSKEHSGDYSRRMWATLSGEDGSFNYGKFRPRTIAQGDAVRILVEPQYVQVDVFPDTLYILSAGGFSWPRSHALESRIEEEIAKCKFDENMSYYLKWSFDELFQNAYDHGNKKDGSKTIYVALAINPQEIALCIRDEGTGIVIDTDTVYDPKRPASSFAVRKLRGIRTGGVAYTAMRNCMDVVAPSPTEGKVTIIKYR